MGEAKRRGTFEERKAQGIARRAAEEARAAEERARIKVERRRQASERQKLLRPQERKERVLVVDDGHSAGLMLATALAAFAPMAALSPASDDIPQQGDTK